MESTRSWVFEGQRGWSNDYDRREDYPFPFQAGFVAADVADKLAHGKVMQAVASAIPYGIQELAKSAEVLAKRCR